MHHRGWVSLIVTFALLSLCACGGGSSSTSATPSGQDSAPSLTELQARLAAEFERLGIDPDKVPAQAPQKDENAVFDLTAELIDPDGDGGDPPTGITLTWTERIIADYNQDGMVTQNDLTPIGQNYCFDMSLPQVGYDDPADHGGFAQWPGGDPDDGDSGSRNWRLARIDGNADGYILQYDITPIAIHWEERLTGYRLYRMAPGEGDFYLIGLIETGRNGTDPVRYSFDNAIEVQGVHSFYVRAYDETSSTEGPPSSVVTIDTTSGIVNQSPIASLSVTPDFAGAPAVITMDATGSYDPDGTVTGYVWDFDGDGTPDWATDDPVPAQSSNGTVTEITPVSDGLVEVTFASGSADWYFPEVVVVDNDGLFSLPTYIQLGVSGWSSVCLIDNSENYLTPLYPEKVSVDPATGLPVICSGGYVPGLNVDQEKGLFLSRQTADLSWELHSLPTPFWLNTSSEHTEIVDFVWNENGLPRILINHIVGLAYDAWIVDQQSDLSWNVFEIIPPEYYVEPNRVFVYPVSDYNPDLFCCKVVETLGDKSDISGTINFHARTHVLFYDSGDWSIEYTGNDTAETWNRIGSLSGYDRSDVRAMYDVQVDMIGGPWQGIWEFGAGFTECERLDDYQMHLGSPSRCLMSLAGLTGPGVSIWEDYSNTADFEHWLLIREPSLTYFNLSEKYSYNGFDCRDALGLYQNDNGIGFFLTYVKQTTSSGVSSIAEHYRLESGNWIIEQIPCISMHNQGPWIIDTTINTVGQPLITYSRSNGGDESDLDESYFISEHLDPRI